jgi:hypothetical protein
MGLTNFPNGISSMGMPVIGDLPPIFGDWFFVNPQYGKSGNSGKEPSKALDSIVTAKARIAAYGSVKKHKGHGICLIPSGTTTAHCSSYLTEELTLDINFLTIIGWGPLSMFAHRARIVNKSTTGEAISNLVTLSAYGCNLINFHIGNYGTTGVGGLTITGNRNRLDHVSIIGGGGVTSAGANDYDLKLTGASENVIAHCAIGSDTKDRGNNASAGLHFGGGCMRNDFEDCILLRYQSSGTGGGAIKFDGSGDAITRNQYLKRCIIDCYDEANAAANTVAVIGTYPNNGRILADPACVVNGYVDWSTAGAVVGAGVAAAASKGGVVADQAA